MSCNNALRPNCRTPYSRGQGIASRASSGSLTENVRRWEGSGKGIGKLETPGEEGPGGKKLQLFGLEKTFGCREI